MRAGLRSGLCSLLLLLCVTVSVFSCVAAERPRPKNVQVALRANWEGTPILLEAGELLHKESKGLYWEFVDAWHQAEKNHVNLRSARDCVTEILRHGQPLLSNSLASLFKFTLTLRSASPMLVLYRQLAEQSLSSFPLADESNPDDESGVASDKSESLCTKRSGIPCIGKNPTSPGRRCCWVDTGGSLFFNVPDLVHWLQSPTNDGGSYQEPELFDFDHIHGDSVAGSPVAVLYGALGTDCFEEFHATLVKAAKEGKVTYVVRPVLPSGCEDRATSCGAVGAKDNVTLSGYGVELALKNMEYKAMDDSNIKKGVTLEDPHTEDLSQEVRGFMFSRILERKPELQSEVMAFRDYLLSSTISDTLAIWELKDLGHQTAQRIVHASDPLQSMQEINNNFPSVVSSLSRMRLNESIKDEILTNQRMVPPGKSLMALNGALVNIEDVDLYSLMDVIHQELLVSDQFWKLKIPKITIRKLLLSMPPPEPDTFRIDFRSSHVHYLNNLEEDAMYRRWRSNINELLMPVFPGQMRYIRKNIFHAVYVVDPATTCGLQSIDTIISLYENNFPMRFGIILYSANLIKIIERSSQQIVTASAEKGDQTAEDLSSLIIRLFMHIKENSGMVEAFQFLSNINRLRAESADNEDSLERYHVEGAFVESTLPRAKTPPHETLLKLEKEQTFNDTARESSLFVFKLGLSKMHCSFLMNGLVFDSVESVFFVSRKDLWGKSPIEMHGVNHHMMVPHHEEAVINAMNEELPRIQEQVYYGNINSRTDVLNKFLSESGVKRYNPQIIAEGKNKPRFVSLSARMLGGELVMNAVNYLHSPDTSDDVKPVTHLIVVNFNTIRGIKLLQEGLRYLAGGSKNARVGVFFSGIQKADRHGLLFAKAFDITVSTYSHNKNVLDFLDKLCSLYEHESLLGSSETVARIEAFTSKVFELAEANGLSSKAYRSSLLEDDDLNNYLSQVTRFLSWEIGLAPGANAVITNGRVIITTEENTLLSHDFGLLESVEFGRRVKHIHEIIEEVEWQDIDPDILTSKFISDVIMYVSSAMSTRDRSSESARFEILNTEHSAVVLMNENSSIHVDAVIDPLSAVGQKTSSLLHILQKHIPISMRIVLNPMSSLVDIPLKNYYRYVLPSVDDFSSNDYTVEGPKAFFTNMPLSKTLTMNLDVPEPWLVEPVIAIHDLDNILLENLGDTRTLQAAFELEALVLTGHCSEKDHEPPRGLQLILGTKNNPHWVDTLVMANLGYWQMKVSPGVWYLRLAPGRSSELYILKGEGNANEDLLKRIVINDLRGKVVQMEVVKRRGKESEKLLVSTGDSGPGRENKKGGWNSNILKWASEIIGGTQQKGKDMKALQQKGERHGKTINIFSIASGHLYERFLKIMILSVLKNTNRPVKFWFIKNYLSPQFKDVIPHMAQEYGFDYELITYKWPSWLHKQKEKQRIIWAYKILFLDVIFPLSLEKVIFVDADQVVRADMGELYDMDIKGRPLAYTPFCDNNKEMDGYRFWRQGFWKEHLRGRPYHISALYVVDLVKFRETAAGDNLRVFYETLSKDPNSLANLDQDLPNYAQHNVPIFSLPQEWLWCESWCGNSTKSRAKTIDLCNNPMTKEPKLQGARRIVSEWTDLDSEARKFTAKILGDTVKVEPVEHSNKPSSKEDLESKAEL